MRTIITYISVVFTACAIVVHSGEAAQMYWTESGGIRRANIDGTNVETLHVNDPAIGYAVNLDIDPVEQKIYWSAIIDQPTRRPVVYRSDLDGSNRVEVLSAGLGPSIYGLGIDPVNRTLYIGQHLPGGPGSGIQRANLDGTGLIKLPPTVYYPHTIEIDPADSKLYFGDVVGFNGLRRADLDGNHVEVLDTGVVVGEAIGLYHGGNKLYYSFNEVGPNQHQIWRSNFDGTDQEVILPSLAERPNNIEFWDGQMYWTSQFGIHRANPDGTDVELVLPLNGDNAWSSDGFAIFVVPEPSTGALAMLGAAGIAVVSYQRRRQNEGR